MHFSSETDRLIFDNITIKKYNIFMKKETPDAINRFPMEEYAIALRMNELPSMAESKDYSTLETNIDCLKKNLGYAL